MFFSRLKRHDIVTFFLLVWIDTIFSCCFYPRLNRYDVVTFFHIVWRYMIFACFLVLVWRRMIYFFRLLYIDTIFSYCFSPRLNRYSTFTFFHNVWRGMILFCFLLVRRGNYNIFTFFPCMKKYDLRYFYTKEDIYFFFFSFKDVRYVSDTSTFCSHCFKKYDIFTFFSSFEEVRYFHSSSHRLKMYHIFFFVSYFCFRILYRIQRRKTNMPRRFLIIFTTILTMICSGKGKLLKFFQCNLEKLHNKR